MTPNVFTPPASFEDRQLVQRQRALMLAKEALLGWDDMGDLIMAARFILTGREPYASDPPAIDEVAATGSTGPHLHFDGAA